MQGKTTGQTPNVPNQHATPSQMEDGKKQLNAAASQLEDGMKQIVDNEKKLDDSQAQISAGREQLTSEQRQLDDTRAQLKDGYAQAEAAGSPAAMIEQLERQQKLYDFASGYRMISEDQSTAIATVSFRKKIYEVPSAELQKVMADLESANLHGATVQFDANLSESALGGGSHTGEVAGMVIAFIVLMVMLGTFVAAGLPILMSLVGVVDAEVAGSPHSEYGC